MLYLFAYYYYGSICSFVLHHYIARSERYTAPVHDYYKNKKLSRQMDLSGRYGCRSAPGNVLRAVKGS